MGRPDNEILERIASFELVYRLIELESREMLAKAGLGHQHFKALPPQRLPSLPEQLPRHDRLPLPFKSIVRKRMKASFPEFKATKVGDDLVYARPLSKHVEVLFGFDHPSPDCTSFSIYLGVRIGDDVLDLSICRTPMMRLLERQLDNADWPFSTDDQLEAALDDVCMFLAGMLPFWERKVREHLVPLPLRICERFSPRQLTAREAYEDIRTHVISEYPDARLVSVESIAALDDALDLDVESVSPHGRLLLWGMWRFIFHTGDKQELWADEYACGPGEFALLPMIDRCKPINESWIDSDAAVAEALKQMKLTPARALERQLQLRCSTDRPEAAVRRRIGMNECWKVAVAAEDRGFIDERWVPLIPRG